MRRILLLLVLGACGNGSGPHGLSLPDGKFGDSPRLSPDGQSIAFVMSGTGAGDVTQVAVMPIGGHSIQVVGPPCGYLSAPAWSPDGALVYLTSDMGIPSV